MRYHFRTCFNALTHVRPSVTAILAVFITCFVAGIALIANNISVTHTRPDRDFTPRMPVPTDFFGMHLMSSANWPSVRIGALGKGTITAWPYIERSRGNYDWSNLDAWLAAAESHGVDFLYTFNYIPKWASSNHSRCVPIFLPGVYNCPGMPNDIGDFDNFVNALVRRYKGRIKYYELWNEPETMKGMSVGEMVALTTHAHDIIRFADPAAKIISPSFYGEFADYMDKYFAAGGVTDVDIVSLHAYTDPTNCTTCILNAPENFTRKGPLLEPVLEVIFKHGLQEKPLWDTEGSWGNMKSGAPHDADQQAAFLARYVLLHWSSGVIRFYWYAWDEDSWGTLWSEAMGASSAARAYGEVQKWMTGAIMNGPCGESGKRIWTCHFRRHNGYEAMAIWTTDAAKRLYAVPKAYTQYRDLSGKTQHVAADAVEVGAAPILLETTPAF